MTSDKLIQLHIFWDSRQQLVVALDRAKEILLGKASRADIPVCDPNVSFIHCMFRREKNGTCFIKDLNSTNGTKVNGRRITGIKQLFSGDLIQFGYITVLFLSINTRIEAERHVS